MTLNFLNSFYTQYITLFIVAKAAVHIFQLEYKEMAFVTGSEEEPVLCFEIAIPSIQFSELSGDLPTASTCFNQLILPLTEQGEEYLFERFEWAFLNTYFGLQSAFIS